MQQLATELDSANSVSLTLRPIPGRMWRTSSGLLDPSTGPRPQRIDIRLPTSLAQLQQAAAQLVQQPPASAPLQNAFMRRQSTMEDRGWDQALAAAGLQSLSSVSSFRRVGFAGVGGGNGLRRPRTAAAGLYGSVAGQSRSRAGSVYQTPMPPPPPPMAVKNTSTTLKSEVVQILSVQQAGQQDRTRLQTPSVQRDALLNWNSNIADLQLLQSTVENKVQVTDTSALQQTAVTAPLSLEQATDQKEQTIALGDVPRQAASSGSKSTDSQRQENPNGHKEGQSKAASTRVRPRSAAFVRSTPTEKSHSVISNNSSNSSSDAGTDSDSDNQNDKKDSPIVAENSLKSAIKASPPQQPCPQTSPTRTSSSRAKPAAGGSGRSRRKLPALLPSLFPGAPAALNFATEGERLEPLENSAHLERIRRQALKWRLSPATPGVVRRVLARSGFKFLPKLGSGDEFDCVESDEWLGYFGRHMKPADFGNIRVYQKVNHFPGSFALGRKDRLWQGLRRMRDRHGDFFDIAPATYCLPEDLRALRQAWDNAVSSTISAASTSSMSSLSSTSSVSSASNSMSRSAESTGPSQPLWILKPPASCRGQGIRLLNKWHQVPKRRAALVQAYIAQPYLIDGSKFDLRVYVFVTSFDPLRAYVHELGLVRFASSQYDPSDPSNRFSHLTNYSVNKHSRTYQASQQDGLGHKWSLQALWARLRSDGHCPDSIWEAVKLVILKALLSAQSHIANQVRLLCRRSCCVHELFGFDVILDENLRPWLLEVNVSPSLNTDTQLDSRIKDAVIADAFRLTGFRLPTIDSAGNVLTVAPESSGDYDSDDYDDDEDIGENGIGKARDKNNNAGNAGLETEAGRGKCAPNVPNATDAHRQSVAPVRSKPTRLADDERAKRAYFCTAGWRRRLPKLLDGPLTPRDVRCLTRAMDEYQRRGGFQRLSPAGGELGLSCLSVCKDRPSYPNLLLHAFITRYGHSSKDGLDLLLAQCRSGLLKSEANGRQLWTPPGGTQ